MFKRTVRTHLDFLTTSVGHERQNRFLQVCPGNCALEIVYVTEIMGTTEWWLPAVVKEVDGQEVQVKLADGRTFRDHVQRTATTVVEGEDFKREPSIASSPGFLLSR